MSDYQSPYKGLLDLVSVELPQKWVMEVMRVWPQLYKEAYERSFNDPAYDTTEGHDKIGVERRALCEKQFRRISVDHGLDAKAIPNRRKTSYYSLLRSGRLILTQSAVQHEWQMARPAMFREQHAALNEFFMSPTLFDWERALPNLSDPGCPYAVLFHGPAPGKPSELGFLVLGFPREGKRDTPFRFPLSLIAQTQSGKWTPADDIEDRVNPRFRKKKKEEGE